ncbi:MAG: DUF4383 domain-containing protein [Xenococcaceae cyanobacterium MO_234.B1]|nr:DUF4383 domain-containing protein [Xenococcaceae cyanobacterium MO_234.B1]
MRLRYFGLVVGILFLLLGILGLIPGLLSLPVSAPLLKFSMGYGYLFGLFPVNLLHNFIHIAIGVWGIIVYLRGAGTRLFARSLAIFLGIMAVLGLIPVTKMLFGLAPLFSHDIWLHALTAAIAAYFGWYRKPKAEDIGVSAAV